MPKRFMWRGADVYLPITFERGKVVEGVRNVHLLGRLKPGVTEAQAEADLRPIIADLKQREPAQFPDQWRVGLLSFKETFPSAIGRDIWVLLGAVGAAAAHRLRERLEPAAVARQRAAARDGGPRRARRGPAAADAPAADREPAPGAGRRRARHRARLRRAARRSWRSCRPTRSRTNPRSRSTRRCCSSRWRVGADEHHLRARPGAAHRRPRPRRMRCAKPAAAWPAARVRRSCARRWWSPKSRCRWCCSPDRACCCATFIDCRRSSSVRRRIGC